VPAVAASALAHPFCAAPSTPLDTKALQRPQCKLQLFKSILLQSVQLVLCSHCRDMLLCAWTRGRPLTHMVISPAVCSKRMACSPSRRCSKVSTCCAEFYARGTLPRLDCTECRGCGAATADFADCLACTILSSTQSLFPAETAWNERFVSAESIFVRTARFPVLSADSVTAAGLQ